MARSRSKRQAVRKGMLLLALLAAPVILNYLSPYIIVEAAGVGVASGSFVVFAGLFVSSLFLGRAFCGWACMGSGLQAACREVSDRPAPGGRRGLIKYWLWGIWMALILALAVQAGGIHSVDFLYMTETGLSVVEPWNYITYYMVLGLIILLALTTGRFGFCHHVCWMAPFMVIGRKLGSWLRAPTLHVTAVNGKCNACGTCDKKCPMSLPVSSMVLRGKLGHTECSLCGECVDACPNQVLRYAFGRPTGARRAPETTVTH